MKDSNLYFPLWRKYLPVIVMKLKNSTTGLQSIQLYKSEFETLGNRPVSDYTFNLEIRNGRVTSDISGTAVARDLYEILISNPDSKKIIASGHFKFGIGKNYVLNISSLES